MPAIRVERRWAILAFSIAYCAFNYGMVAAGFTFWVAPWMHDFKVSRSLIMTVFTVASLVMVLASPLIGRVLDFISVRMSLTAGAVALAAGLTGAALSRSFWVLFALYATVIPLGCAFAATLPATVLGVRMFPGRAGLVNGLMALSLGLAAVLMAAFAVPLIGAAGWRGTFLVAAGVIFAVIAPVGWFLMDVEAGAPAKTLKTPPTEGAVSADGFNALRQPVFWMLLLAIMPIMFTLGAVPPNLAPIAADAGIDAGHAAILVSIFSIASAAGSLGGGWLADRVGPRLFYAAVLLSIVTVTLVLAQRPGFVLLAVVLGVLGAAGGSLMPWVSVMVIRTFGAEGFARVFGLLTPFFLPVTIAPILFGWIRDHTGGYQAAFLLFAVLLAPGALGLLIMRPPAKPALAPAQ